METNADLYKVVTTALSRRDRGTRPLEPYLRTLAALLDAAGEEALSPAAFAAALDAAFEGPVPDASDDALRAQMSDEGEPDWKRQVARQILDLREMTQAGTLARDDCYFGVDAPSGARWYNVDPHSFIECGLAGSVGGWTPEANRGRMLVPGPVALLDEEGALTTAMPEDIEEPTVDLQAIGWDDVADFLWAGQNYE